VRYVMNADKLLKPNGQPWSIPVPPKVWVERKLVDGVETSEQRMEQLPPREPNIAEWMEHYLDQLPSKTAHTGTKGSSGSRQSTACTAGQLIQIDVTSTFSGAVAGQTFGFTWNTYPNGGGVSLKLIGLRVVYS
jgi:hypothetical protein